MTQYRYTTVNKNILIIKNALETCSLGIGLSIMCDISFEKKGDSTTIIFTPKNQEKQINPIEFFAFGLIIGNEYMK